MYELHQMNKSLKREDGIGRIRPHNEPIAPKFIILQCDNPTI